MLKVANGIFFTMLLSLYNFDRLFFSWKQRVGGQRLATRSPPLEITANLGRRGCTVLKTMQGEKSMKKNKTNHLATLTMFRQSQILKSSGCLVLVRTIQSYLVPWAAKGSTIPLCRLGIKVLLEIKIHAHIRSCMAILCILFGWQFLTLKINFTF